MGILWKDEHSQSQEKSHPYGHKGHRAPVVLPVCGGGVWIEAFDERTLCSVRLMALDSMSVAEGPSPWRPVPSPCTAVCICWTVVRMGIFIHLLSSFSFCITAAGWGQFLICSGSQLRLRNLQKFKLFKLYFSSFPKLDSCDGIWPQLIYISSSSLTKGGI